MWFGPSFPEKVTELNDNPNVSVNHGAFSTFVFRSLCFLLRCLSPTSFRGLPIISKVNIPTKLLNVRMEFFQCKGF